MTKVTVRVVVALELEVGDQHGHVGPAAVGNVVHDALFDRETLGHLVSGGKHLGWRMPDAAGVIVDSVEVTAAVPV